MGINIKEVFIEQNNNKIKEYEMLIKYTNKTTLKNKHVKNYNKCLSAKDNIDLIMNLIVERTKVDFIKELKKRRLIKRLK